MTPAERIASDTWHRLGKVKLLGARLGEETLTDLLVLDMLPHRRMNAFSIQHPTKSEESLIGADLLICIRYPDGSGRRLALQAKKLYPTGRYDALGHKDASGTLQIDKLEKFARWWGAVPAYLLYNHERPLPSSHAPHLHCCRAYDPEQLGCTLVPAWRIRDAIQFRGNRSFRALHAHPPTRPWRCVFDCHKPMEQMDELALSRPEPRTEYDNVVFHRQRPDWIHTDAEAFDILFDIHEPLPAADLNRLLARPIVPSVEHLGHRESLYPRRVLAVDVEDSRKEPESE